MPDDKFDEKALEKQEEKSRDEKRGEEKNWEEKWRRDPITAVVWAILFIWAGVVLLFDNLGLLQPWLSNLAATTGLQFLGRMQAWSVILVGAGLILLLEVVVRLLIPEYRRSVAGTLFFAIVLIGIGLGNEIGWTLVLPLALIGLGLSVLLRGLTRGR
jgi:hypothetical protein